jgi:hypothetical protein
VFAGLNTGLYWALKPILDLATLGALGFFMPFIVNMVLLVATVKFFAWEKLPRFITKQSADAKQADAKPLFEIRGIMTTLWMALILTAARRVVGRARLPAVALITRRLRAACAGARAPRRSDWRRP